MGLNAVTDLKNLDRFMMIFMVDSLKKELIHKSIFFHNLDIIAVLVTECRKLTLPHNMISNKRLPRKDCHKCFFNLFGQSLEPRES